MKRIKIVQHLSNDELKLHYDECLNPTVKERWHLLWLVQVKGLNAQKASELIGRNHSLARTGSNNIMKKGFRPLFPLNQAIPLFIKKK